MVYLDYAAGSPVDREALELFNKLAIENYANPNSSHKLGLRAKELIDEYTKKIAEKLHVLSEEIIYTSGATEANNLAIKGTCERYKSHGKHILISALEHNSVVASATYLQELGFEVEIIPIDKSGIVDLDTLKNLVRDDTILVSVTSIDSELGIRQPIEKVADFLKNYPNVVFHTDASQAIGKVEINYSNVDLITIAPHKFGALNGMGLLIKKKNTSIQPIIHGGKSTTVYRSGTPILPLIGSLSVSISHAIDNLEKNQGYIKKLNIELVNFLSNYKNVHINTTAYSIPNMINFSVQGIKSTEFAKLLENKDIYLSTKTSCCPIESPSKLVYALTHNKSLSSTSLRLSLSYHTTKEDISQFKKSFDEIYKELESNGKI